MPGAKANRVSGALITDVAACSVRPEIRNMLPLSFGSAVDRLLCCCGMCFLLSLICGSDIAKSGIVKSSGMLG